MNAWTNLSDDEPLKLMVHTGVEFSYIAHDLVERDHGTEDSVRMNLYFPFYF